MKFRSDSERKGRPECHPQLRLLNKSPFQGLQMKNQGWLDFHEIVQSHISISTFTNISIFLLQLCYLPFCENSNVAH